MNINSTLFSIPCHDGSKISMTFVRGNYGKLLGKIIVRHPDGEITYSYAEKFFKALLIEGKVHGGFIWQKSKR